MTIPANPSAPKSMIGILVLAAVAMHAAILSSPLQADDSKLDVAIKILQSHCNECHGNEAEIEGDINLLELQNKQAFLSKPELLRDLVDVLESETMPPEDESQLSAESRKQLRGFFSGLLYQAVHASTERPTTPIRRMNRFQYSNAVEDLFQLNVEVFALPERMLRDYGYFNPASGKMPDTLKAGSRPLGKSQLIGKRLAGVAPFPQDLRAENGYDNRGDHLTLSPLLLESFFKLGQSIVDSSDFNAKTCGVWDSLFAPPVDGKDVQQVVRGRLESFLQRAFRRPQPTAVVDRYTTRVMSLIEQGEPFTDSMKVAVSSSLASPRFLYLYDQADADPSHADYALASRLSFFLWGSIPDQPLLDLARSGSLSDPAVLSQQVDRMLNDHRLKRFCDSFPSQWLQLERIISSVPDPELFPEFYFAKFRVSMHMMLEPLLLFETVLIEDRPITQLIDSDFSYRSDTLASWYRDGKRGAKTPPTAIPFRRVKIDDRRQGGVITNAAVMTMTSAPTRTQPITRGAWIANVIFNDPPDPPPADVPPLEEDDAAVSELLTLRERFASHRERSACAVCHVKIDPLGFALENFDSVGVWRDQYSNGRDVDSSGVLFRKHKFDHIVAFKDAILLEKDRFARAFAAHLLSFALARQMTVSDWPALDDITERNKQADYRMRDLIKQIVLSEPFLAP